MADTIAVMNAGVIEQLGTPAELYEHPATTFAANFLGQSNLVAGRVVGSDPERLLLDVQGVKLTASEVSSGITSGDVWVGVRPEKVGLTAPGAAPSSANTLGGGRVSDASFVGVSTQYLVRMPWGQELQVFEQNTGRRRMFRRGDRVELSWRPEFAFLLDHSQDASAGAQRMDAS